MRHRFRAHENIDSKMNWSAAFVICLLTWVAVVNAYEYHSEEECLSTEVTAVLDISLDENSDQTGWLLECDGAVIWDVPAGSLSDPEGTWIKESSCIAETTKCSFTITDSGGDGLTGDGFYTLIHGATTVAVSEYGKTVPFSENTVCFGRGCTDPPLEQVDTGDESENVVDTPDEEAEDIQDEPEESGTTVAEPTKDENTDTKVDGKSDKSDAVTGTDLSSSSDSPSSDDTKAIIIGCSVGAAIVVLALLLRLFLRRKSTSRLYVEKDDDDDDDTKASDNNQKVIAAETFVEDEAV